jgi:hypothetical protein
MAVSHAQKLVAEIAERITERRRIYDAAMEADVALLCRAHGAGLVVEALKRLKAPRDNGTAYERTAGARGRPSALAKIAEAALSGAQWTRGGRRQKSRL